MTVGIFGGTFDPPHLGHLHVLETACRIFDHVLVIPNNQSPHKTSRPVDGILRLEMLKKLTSQFHNCSIETLEIEKEGPSYFSETLAVLKTRFPHDYFTLILGEDQFATIKSWHKSDEWFSTISYFVLPRGAGTTSSTKIRGKIKSGEDVSGSVLPEILQIIKECNLYIGV